MKPKADKMIFFARYTALLLSVVLILSSCATQKQLEYIQTRGKEKKEFSKIELVEYTIKTNDELYIQISSLDETASNVFKGSERSTYGSMDAYSASLISYTVDKNGFVDLPVLGKIQVQGKTVTQVVAMLKESLVNILSQPVVTVKLVNRNVSVLGEVRNPGHFIFSQGTISIFDAVGLAGDITDYGNRKKVILLRRENDHLTKTTLDLTKTDILESPYFYVRPNDIVYVKPLRNKLYSFRPLPFSIILSSITTGILVLSYMNTNK
jgi:polysaccharide biosynthesis/export protein